MKRWQRKALALIKIAENNRDNSAGIEARAKLARITAQHAEAKDYAPIKMLNEHDEAAHDVALIRAIDPKWNVKASIME